MAFDSDSIGGVFDDAASERLHMSKREDWHRHAVDEYRRIFENLSWLSVSTQQFLKFAFTPYGAERASYALRVGFTRDGLCLLDVGIRTPLAAREWQKSHECILPKVETEWMVPWLETEVRKFGRGSLLNTRLIRLVDEAEETVKTCLEEYQVSVEARQIRKSESQTELVESYVEGIRKRIF